MRPFVTVFGMVLLAAACSGPNYRMSPPETFKRYERSRDFRWITADGVMLKAREVDNYPRADLPFWTDALKRHLIARGYAHAETACFRTDRGLDGCTLDFVLPRGAEDWVMSETVFVVDDRVVLVEAAGPFVRYAKVKDDLRRSLTTFEPGP